jgi:hypothetical protein
MTPAQLLADFAARGIRLSHHGAELHVAPRALLETGDRAALVAHKPALLVLLVDLAQLERDGTAAQLRAVAATLTPDEHRRLAQEAAGDRLPQLVQAVLALSTGPEGS